MPGIIPVINFGANGQNVANGGNLNNVFVNNNDPFQAAVANVLATNDEIKFDESTLDKGYTADDDQFKALGKAAAGYGRELKQRMDASFKSTGQ